MYPKNDIRRSVIPWLLRLASRATAAACWGAVASASLLLAAEGGAGDSAGPPVSVQPLPASGAERIPEKVRRYAERLLRRYDANVDGKLQREEWSKMHGSPEAADVNGDGVITLDELLNSIAAFGRNRRIGLADSIAGQSPRDNPDPPPAGPNAPPPASQGGQHAIAPAAGPPSGAGGASRGGATFYVPKSRLPSGLPEWFSGRDLDGDGQLSLAEYAPNPTQADLEDYARYDRNGDGFITARECLDAVKPSKPGRRKAGVAPDNSGGKGGEKAAAKKAAASP